MTSQPRRKTPYVSMNVTVPVRDGIQALTFTLQAETGRRIPMSHVLDTLLRLADSHPDELRELLANPPEPNGEAQ